MEIQVRSAKEEDVKAILEIINFEISNTTSVYDHKERTTETQSAWLNKKEKEMMPVVVAEMNGTVVGYGTYGIFRPWDGYRYSIEHSMYVHNDSRGLGIGKLIMAELIKLATIAGYHTMIAGVDASNKGSYEFHKKFGFIEIGTFKEIGYKFNKWLDLIFMQLILDGDNQETTPNKLHLP
jgi:phosphinothricin acetyltransferase